ncbi:MAG: hypothetical protein LM601_11485 [Candidatus Verstraetearchaeota archaeon]|nr:hypothetical protein [Candidatus Verstraetearchaeota archaeon]
MEKKDNNIEYYLRIFLLLLLLFSSYITASKEIIAFHIFSSYSLPFLDNPPHHYEKLTRSRSCSHLGVRPLWLSILDRILFAPLSSQNSIKKTY